MDFIKIKNTRTIKRIQNSYQWIFSNELEELPDIDSGSLVKVIDKNNNSYGLGFYNRNSLIAIRLLNSDTFDFDFVKKRIANAKNLRKNFFHSEDSYRLIFGESDFLPGLIVDKYSDYLSMQILSAGFEKNKEIIIQALISEMPDIKGIYSNNNVYWRKIESLATEDKIEFGVIPDLININENSISYNISITKGQKTGYFFDQRLNRQFLQRISENKTVLDLFCNQGGFALNAMKGNAKECTGIDISESAVKMAQENMNLNFPNNANIHFEVADIFDFLKITNEKWDIVVCDPPAFAKNKKSVTNAKAAYKRLNKMSLNKVKENGILLTSSCSQHITEDTFYQSILSAAQEANKNLKLIYTGLQSPDHPILIAMPETRYLKFFGFVVSSL
jgi:23S rRNA (cytosine1962-C5)-methyltransferase